MALVGPVVTAPTALVAAGVDPRVDSHELPDIDPTTGSKPFSTAEVDLDTDAVIIRIDADADPGDIGEVVEGFDDAIVVGVDDVDEALEDLVERGVEVSSVEPDPLMVPFVDEDYWEMHPYDRNWTADTRIPYYGGGRFEQGPYWLNAARGWVYSTGPANPLDVVVAVVDTGVAPPRSEVYCYPEELSWSNPWCGEPTHPQMAGRVLTGFSATDQGTDGLPVESNRVHSHGTEVASVIASDAMFGTGFDRHGDNISDVVGMCWSCAILPVDVFGTRETAYHSDIASGIIWATDNGASVINLSLGGPVGSGLLHDAIKYAVRNDVVVVASAGNNGTTKENYPAAYEEVIGVAANRPQSWQSREMVAWWQDLAAPQRKFEFSSWGDWVDVSAPGCTSSVVYSGAQGASCGTSISAPLVAGAAALLRAARPDATAAEVRAAIQNTATENDFTAYGLPDVAKAMEYLGAEPRAFEPLYPGERRGWDELLPRDYRAADENHPHPLNLAVSDRQVAVSFDAPTAAGAPVTSYEAQCSSVTDPSRRWTAASASLPVRISVPNDVALHCSARARNSVGWSHWSPATPRIGSVTAPGVPVGLQAGARHGYHGPEWVRVWVEATPNISRATRAQFRCTAPGQSTFDRTVENSDWYEGDPTDMFDIDTGDELVGNVEYRCVARIANANGWTAWSEPSFITRAGPPPAPEPGDGSGSGDSGSGGSGSGGSGSDGSGSGGSGSSAGPASSGFEGLNPARLLDTRPGGSTVDGQFAGMGVVQRGNFFRLPVAGRGGVAQSAESVTLNVAVVDPFEPGYLTVWPCDGLPPNASSINYWTGQAVANSVVVKLSDAGEVCLFSWTETHVIVDVAGQFIGSDSFRGVRPARLFETRLGSQTIDDRFNEVGALDAGSVTRFPVAGRGGIGRSAGSVALNVTVAGARQAGFVTVWECDGAMPNASSVNFPAEYVVANALIAKLSSSGDICVYTSADTHLLVDVMGEFIGSDSFTGLRPARLLDSRDGGSTVDGRFASMGVRDAGSVTRLAVGGRGGVGRSAGSVALNVAVVGARQAGFVTVWPCDGAMPNASSVNYASGQTIANALIAKLSSSGDLCVYTSADIDLLVDVSGVFR